ncbi:hypothetical protein [Marinoscillum sp. MHG1-6]|uniref:hypothetical protein n=1 Tax=Marinoscillum sp. MHG1-6 TaxID=2959627 RepID=UPI002157E70D|nr:hypothetical protein [Marinoscillum sp. MHG1-6]
MITATVKQLKDELKVKDKEELLFLCLTLAKFKKETKELLTYLLFESSDEMGFISGVKAEITEDFMEVNTSSIYYVKKSARKILRNTKKYIRYSKNKQTEVELLIHYCRELIQVSPSVMRSVTMKNLYQRQLDQIKKSIKNLHEDLQHDYALELEQL